MMSKRDVPIRHARAKGGTGDRLADARASVLSNGPTEAEIRRRAHEIYLNRAGCHGDALGDWLLAELELRARAIQSRLGDSP